MTAVQCKKKKKLKKSPANVVLTAQQLPCPHTRAQQGKEMLQQNSLLEAK